MKSHPRIAELLVETGAYKDLNHPVILTFGELGIYYINAEKLCQDGGKFKEFGNDSLAMIQHAVRMEQEHPTFNEVIEIITAEVLDKVIHRDKEGIAISGGQRRDWLFSGPVASKLNLPHISLYKQEKGKPDKVEIIYPNQRVKEVSFQESLKGFCSVHIPDLLTEASSCYRVEEGRELGWVPMQRQRGATIKNLVAVVTRLQGGEERLLELAEPVNASAFVAIDCDFLKQHSKNPERALAYAKDPKAWSENYLRENGALDLIEAFDPDGGKLTRAIKFTERYADVLEKANKFNELDAEVRKRYGVQLK